jgi:hypothetical protein
VSAKATAGGPGLALERTLVLAKRQQFSECGHLITNASFHVGMRTKYFVAVSCQQDTNRRSPLKVIP